MKYLSAYPQAMQAQVQELIAQNRLGSLLSGKYPNRHAVRTDRALYDYVLNLKNEFLRKTEPLNKVCFDSKLHVVQHALGTHTSISRVQGNKLKAKCEIRIATLFKHTPPEFLKMITVHELAHTKVKVHDKAFYQLCTHMEPNYHQLEFDFRLYLTHLERVAQPVWPSAQAGT